MPVDESTRTTNGSTRFRGASIATAAVDSSAAASAIAATSHARRAAERSAADRSCSQRVASAKYASTSLLAATAVGLGVDGRGAALAVRGASMCDARRQQDGEQQ